MKKFLNTLALSLCLLFGSTWLFATDYPGGGGGDHTASSTTILTNKTVDLTDNTVTGTFAEFNTAISDASVLDATTIVGLEVVRKTSDEDVTSSTSLQADDQLLYALGATEVTWFRFFLIVDGGVTGDLKFAVDVPADATLNVSYSGNIHIDNGDAIGFDNNQTSDNTSMGHQGLGGTGTNRQTIIEGIVVGGGTAGNVVLNWAQQTSNGTASSVQANSYLVVARL